MREISNAFFTSYELDVHGAFFRTIYLHGRPYTDISVVSVKTELGIRVTILCVEMYEDKLGKMQSLL